MTAPDVQDSMLEHLDFPTPCGQDDCERPADFIEQCRFCRYSAVICGLHLTEFLDMDKLGGLWECDQCLQQKADFLALVAITPFRP